VLKLENLEDHAFDLDVIAVLELVGGEAHIGLRGLLGLLLPTIPATSPD
jgi:hypothetical protein